MNNEFVPYEQSVELKELGFDEPCFGSYQLIENRDYENGLKINHIIGLNTLNGIRNHNYKDEITNVPTFSQAFRWFREKYKLHYSIDYECSQHDHKWGYNWTIYNYSQVVKTNEEYIQSNPIAPAGEWVYETHEEAELACLRKLIEIANEQQ